MTDKYLRTGIARSGRTRRFSTVDHLCIVSHTFGPYSSQKWVKPICGARPGKADGPGNGPLCQRCEKRESREEEV